VFLSAAYRPEAGAETVHHLRFCPL